MLISKIFNLLIKELMIIMVNKIVSFSGYRPEKFAFIIKKGEAAYLALEKRIEDAVIKAVEDGYNTFFCGMAMGFDLIAGSTVYHLKETRSEMSNISLVAVLPFENHGFSNPWQVIHQVVLGKANEVITLSSKYYRQSYHDRNRYMVDHSSRLICYYDGQKGGTDFTVRYAKEKGLEVVNVF